MPNARPIPLLPLFLGSGIVAIIDALLQSTQAGFALFLPSLSFNILGAWPIAFLAGLVALIYKGEKAYFQIGCLIGAWPLLHLWIPHPFSYAAFFILLLICWRAKSIIPINKTTTKAILTTLGAITLISVLIPNKIPAHPTSFPESIKESPQDAPDIILISIDTLRADSVFDDLEIKLNLPGFQQLREKSLWADYGLSSSNQTLPGHLGMLTGLNAMHHGTRSNYDQVDKNLELLAEKFTKSGYQTSAVISNALLSAATGMHRGFQNFSDEAIGLARTAMKSKNFVTKHSWISMILGGPRTNEIYRNLYFRKHFSHRSLAKHCTDIALKQMQEARKRDQPLFQFIHLMDPHTNYAPPADIRGQISSALAKNIDKVFLPNANPGEESEITVELVRYVQKELQKSNSEALEAATYYYQVYLEEIIEVDQQLQRIFKDLEESERDYVLLLTADHGEQFGENNLMDHANSLYDANLHVPFLLTGTNIKPGKIKGVPQLCDVAPTLLSLAGLDHTSLDGEVVTDNITPRPHFSADQKQFAITLPGGYRFITNHGSTDISIDDRELLAKITPLVDYYYDEDLYDVKQKQSSLSSDQANVLDSLGYADQEDDR